jgi:hypothetical protein
VLLPKSDPEPSKVASERHFRFKDLAAQQQVHDNHYPEYREVNTVELMTAVLLHDLVNKERLLPYYLRCEEPNTFGGRVCVGDFNASGLRVSGDNGSRVNEGFGRALVRKL